MSNDRVLQAIVELGTARRNLSKLEAESKREKRPVPHHLVAQHREIIGLYSRNLSAAHAASEAGDRFPPVRR